METITNHITKERTIHAVMVAFALFSVGNVASFLTASGHYFVVSLTGALALGAAVATSAIMLTGIDMVKQRGRYIAMLVIVHATVAASGFVQTQNYLDHGMSAGSAALMGFGIVWVGECLTAIGLSLYQAAERRRKIDEADSGLELKLAEAFGDVLDAVDSQRSVRHVERHIDTIIKHKADELLAKYVPAEPDPNPLPSKSVVQPATTHQNRPTTFGPASLPTANAARFDDRDARRQAAFATMTSLGGRATNGEVRKALAAQGWTVSADTVTADLKSLGCYQLDGDRRWHLDAMPLLDAMPKHEVEGIPHANGAAV